MVRNMFCNMKDFRTVIPIRPFVDVSPLRRFQSLWLMGKNCKDWDFGNIDYIRYI